MGTVITEITIKWKSENIWRLNLKYVQYFVSHTGFLELFLCHYGKKKGT